MVKDLRTKSDNELGNLISKLKVQLLEMRFKIANGEVEGVHKLKEIRKTIAMAMTVLSERDVKISFSSFDTQLIKQKDGKQEISSLPIIEEDKRKDLKKINQEKLVKPLKTDENQKKITTEKDSQKSQHSKKIDQPVKKAKTVKNPKVQDKPNKKITKKVAVQHSPKSTVKTTKKGEK